MTLLKGDLVKKGDSLEYWLEDSLYGIKFTKEQIDELAKIMNPLRPQLEEAMNFYEQGIDNWKHFRIALWKAVPSDFQRKVSQKIDLFLKNGEALDRTGKNRKSITK